MRDDGEHPGSHFVERFADVLVASGVPRMPSRVLAQLTATDEGRLTAGELAASLHASPAAISGAVRYLEQVGLIRRTRTRGSRRDHVVLSHDRWYDNVVGRMDLVALWASVLREGADAVGRESPAGRRLLESSEFFEFLRAEMPKVTERWLRSRAARDRQPPAGRGPGRAGR